MGLSLREQEIVDMVVAGASNKEIGKALFITEKTVKFHLTNIYAKLGITSRAQLIVMKLRQRKEDDKFCDLMRELIK